MVVRVRRLLVVLLSLVLLAGGVPAGALDGSAGPRGVVDRVELSADGVLGVFGWAFDPDFSGSVPVHVYVDGVLVGGVSASLVRADVNAVFGLEGGHGYSARFEGVDPFSVHSVCVYAIDSVGGDGNRRIGCKQVGPYASAGPRGVVDRVELSADGVLGVFGWAFDPDFSGSVPVHVYVDGVLVGGVSASLVRADVNAVFGLEGGHGYSARFEGLDASLAHRVCVFAIDQVGNNPNNRIGCKWTGAPMVGEGRRIVYSNADQTVWIVDEEEVLVDSYPVSGRQGVPAPGRYGVFSKSPTTRSLYGGISMDYMVRFAWGVRAAIGFHGIPRYADGTPLQDLSELGEFRSAGCVRQADEKAKALYDWADVGTVVFVLP